MWNTPDDVRGNDPNMPWNTPDETDIVICDNVYCHNCLDGPRESNKSNCKIHTGQEILDGDCSGYETRC